MPLLREQVRIARETLRIAQATLQEVRALNDKTPDSAKALP